MDCEKQTTEYKSLLKIRTGDKGFKDLSVTCVALANAQGGRIFIGYDDKKKTLPILIAQLRAADWLKFDMGQVYVMIAFSIFPVIVVYLILSKHIVQGVALGSVKG